MKDELTSSYDNVTHPALEKQQKKNKDNVHTYISRYNNVSAKRNKCFEVSHLQYALRNLRTEAAW